MCIAVAAEILELLENKEALVSVRGNKMKVNVGLVDTAKGDFVLIHAGCAIEVITSETADEITELFNLIEESAEDII